MKILCAKDFGKQACCFILGSIQRRKHMWLPDYRSWKGYKREAIFIPLTIYSKNLTAADK